MKHESAPVNEDRSTVFRVMKTHTSSGSKVLWSVESRAFKTRMAAEDWREFLESQYREEHPKGPHRFFVIETDFTGTVV